jgi:hypothetical protein
MPYALIALLSSAAQVTPLPAQVAQPVCQNTRPGVASTGSLYDRAGKARAQQLGTLPPANHILTVLRREDGCERPVIVRYGIGGTSRAQP